MENWQDFLDKVIIKKIDVEDKVTVNAFGELENIRYYDITVQPKATLQYIEVDFTIAASGDIDLENGS